MRANSSAGNGNFQGAIRIPAAPEKPGMCGSLNQATTAAIKATHDATDPVLKAGSDIELKR
jgi:hypothetical protein